MLPEKKPTRRGPPNRMNDLDYKTWMKFQKSFFWYTSWQCLSEECVHFFTKSRWEDGRVSKSLIIGHEPFDDASIKQPRSVEYVQVNQITDTINVLEGHLQFAGQIDFIFIDLRDLIYDQKSLEIFLAHYSQNLFSLMRKLLAKDRYCGLMVNGTVRKEDDSFFPLAWSVASACRKHLRLRDEKIGLIEESDSTLYCLFMQAQDDGFTSIPIKPTELDTVKTDFQFPAWTIPKPPPRKKNEILHPAKYPETLIEPFIEIFTDEDDNVLDPMVGTGSTVIASIRCNRHGYGVDLIDDFVKIARERAAYEKRPMLFPEFETDVDAVIVQGDARQIATIPEIANNRFRYAITSPPYWSMLSNPGSENQRNRRKRKLQLVYSENERDLGNIQDYNAFLDLLIEIYTQISTTLTDNGHLTVIVKNVKRDHVLYTLGWDLVAKLCSHNGPFAYVGTTLWCQDDIGLKPFAVGTHWISNTLHNYCLHFQKK